MIAATFNGLTLLGCMAVIGVFWLTIRYLAWRTHDRWRRSDRRCHVNLIRQTGGTR